MSAQGSIQVFIDEETGEMWFEIDGLPEKLCENTAAALIEGFKMQGATVKKTNVGNAGGDGQKRTQSIG
jgi:hypothetical protein|tara:strand:+ start:203 stop:409 length:207 start_codon:yes stop_codon:yes gene_type:complete